MKERNVRTKSATKRSFNLGIENRVVLYEFCSDAVQRSDTQEAAEWSRNAKR